MVRLRKEVLWKEVLSSALHNFHGPAPTVGKGITRRDLCVKEANFLLCKNQADIK